MRYVSVVESERSRPAVYCDFDGTIALEDVTDALLSRLADKEWLAIESEWERGIITARECMARQVPLIKGGWGAVKSVLSEIRLDPSFAPFAFWCAESGIPLMVVSDGLDKVIQHLLWRDDIPVDGIWANQVNCDGDRLSLTFPPLSSQTCETGVCKCHIMSKTSGPGAFRIVIGDGKSDYCWAQKADLVFAKSKLLEFCSSQGIPCHPFHDFALIRQSLEMRFAVAPVMVEQYQPGMMNYAM